MAGILAPMQDLLRPVLDQIGKLWSRVDQIPVIRWGTVVQASPVRVTLDGDFDPLPLSPQNAAGELREGARVLCVEQHRRVIVVKSSRERAPFAMAAGEATITVSPASAQGTVTVVFPAGTFTVVPHIFVMKRSGSMAKYIPYLSGLSATSVTIGIYSGDGSASSGSVALSWQAVQMTAGSASG